MVIGQEVGARCEHDPLGLAQRLRDQEIGRGARLPRRGEVLADPGLAEAEPVERLELLEVVGERVGRRGTRRVKRHREVAKLHGMSLLRRQPILPSWRPAGAQVTIRPVRRLAIISDVHGNLIATRDVLAEQL